jgi:hypothetical protein
MAGQVGISIPLIIVMLVTIVSIKIPIWLGHDFWIFRKDFRSAPCSWLVFA